MTSLFPLPGEQTDIQDSSMEVWLHENMDNAMEGCIEKFSEASFSQMMGYIISEAVGVDYQHTSTFMTALMVGLYLIMVQLSLDLLCPPI